MRNKLNESPPYAIVIGLDNITGLQTARILNERRVQVIGVAKNIKHYCCKTNVCERILKANTDNDEIIDILLELGPQFSKKPVLVPCTDTSVITISQHREVLKNIYRIALPDKPVVDTLINKDKFYQYALENTLPIPTTWFASSMEEITLLLDVVVYPCIVKPPYRPEIWKANLKQKAFIIKDNAELLDRARQLFQYVDMLIIQRIIEGPDQNHITGNCYYDRENHPLVVYTSKKIRQWPLGTGQACSSESVIDEVVIETMLQLFSGIGYYGLGYLEMKKDEKSGRYYIIEPNIGRPTGRSAAAEASGVELIYTMYCDLLGWPLPKNRKQKPDGAKWFHLQKDIQSSLTALLKRQLNLGTWIKSIQGHKVYALLSIKDPKPFTFSVFYLVQQTLNRILRNETRDE